MEDLWFPKHAGNFLLSEEIHLTLTSRDVFEEEHQDNSRVTKNNLNYMVGSTSMLVDCMQAAIHQNI